MIGKVASDCDVASGAGSSNIQSDIGGGSREIERTLVLSVLESRFAFGNGFDEPGGGRANWKSPRALDCSSERCSGQGRVGACDVLQILFSVGSGISGAGGDRSSEGYRFATS